MSFSVIFFAALSAGVLLLLVWALRRPPGTTTSPPAIEDLTPRHCRHFPQMCQVMRKEDSEFVRQRTPREVERRWHSERRRIMKKYLAALADDFLQLEELARVVASLSPRVAREQEAERFWLGVHFRLLFRLVSARVEITGRISVPELARLTELLARLAAQMEAATRSLGQGLAPPMPSGFSL